MDTESLNQRCIELMQSQAVRSHMWHATMFWEVGDLDNPRPEDLTRPRFDLEELEVLLSSAADQDSACVDSLNARTAGRGDFIRRAVKRGDLPLLGRTIA